MKLFSLSLIFSLVCTLCAAQVSDFQTDSTKVYSLKELEKNPEYKGGVNALSKFIRQSIVYPEAAANAKEGGLVIVSITIDQQGNVSNPQIIKSADKTIQVTDRQDLNEEAIRVIMLTSGQWLPGRIQEQNVSSIYLMPIRFFPPILGKKKK